MADSPSYVPQTSETNPVKQNVAIQQLYTSVADAASAAGAAALKTTTISAGTGLTGGGDLSANRTIALGVPVAVANGGTGAATAAAARGNLAAATTTQTDFISGIIKTPANQDYRIVERLPYAVTFTRLTAKCASGSVTMTVKVNAAAIGNFTQSVGTGQITTTSAAPNTAALADVIVVTISAAAGAVDLSFTLDFTRTLS